MESHTLATMETGKRGGRACTRVGKRSGLPALSWVTREVAGRVVGWLLHDENGISEYTREP